MILLGRQWDKHVVQLDAGPTVPGCCGGGPRRPLDGGGLLPRVRLAALQQLVRAVGQARTDIRPAR